MFFNDHDDSRKVSHILRELGAQKKLFAPRILETEVVRAFCKIWLRPENELRRSELKPILPEMLRFIAENVNLSPANKTMEIDAKARTVCLQNVNKGHLFQTYDLYYVTACYCFRQPAEDGVIITFDKGMRKGAKRAGLRIFPEKVRGE